MEYIKITILVFVSFICFSGRMVAQDYPCKDIVDKHLVKTGVKSLTDSIESVKLVTRTKGQGFEFVTELLIIDDGKIQQKVITDDAGTLTMCYNGEFGWLIFPERGIIEPVLMDSTKVEQLKSPSISSVVLRVHDFNEATLSDTIKCGIDQECVVIITKDETRKTVNHFLFSLKTNLLLEYREFEYDNDFIELESSYTIQFKEYKHYNGLLYPSILESTGIRSPNSINEVLDVAINPNYSPSIFIFKK